MAFSYSGDPQSEPKDAVRFLVGDTDESDPLLSDEEINFLVAEEPNRYAAAAAACRSIAAKLAREYERMESETLKATDRTPERYRQLAMDLDKRAVTSSSVSIVAADGITEVEPFFTRGMFRNDWGATEETD